MFYLIVSDLCFSPYGDEQCTHAGTLLLLIQHIFVPNREDDESSLVKGKQVKVVKSGSSVILDGYIRINTCLKAFIYLF